MSQTRYFKGRMSRLLLAVMMVLTMLASQSAVPAGATWQTFSAPEVVSVDAFGNEANRDCGDSRASDDGRYVVFESYATNLVEGSIPDDDHKVFRHDRVTGETRLVNEPEGGPQEITSCAHDPKISDDGRYVLFTSGDAFVPEDTNGAWDIYVRDMHTGAFQWVDFKGDGSTLSVGEADVSGDGKYVVFDSYGGDLLETGRVNEQRNVWGYDLESEEATLVSVPASGTAEADRGARSPAIDDSGHYVVFLTGDSWDPNDTNGGQDLYVRDLQTGELRWVDFTGGEGAVGSDVYDIEMSGDGSRIAFETDDDLLPGDDYRRDVYSYDLVSDEATLVSGPHVVDRGSRNPSITDDGRYVAFYTGQGFSPEDTNEGQDVYVKDMATGEFQRLAILGDEGLPGEDIDTVRISGDGAHVVFDGYLDGDGDRRPTSVGEPGSASRNARTLASECSPRGAALIDPAAEGSGYEQVYHWSMVEGMAKDARRLSGPNRYATAIGVSRSGFPQGASTVIVATGENWPDALCGAGLAGAVDGPVLLTRSDTLLPEVKAEIARLGADNAYILGSDAAIADRVEHQLDAMLTGFVWRIGGSDRYATSRNVADRAVAIMGEDFDGHVCVATGEVFADAVGAAPLSAGLGWPILLVRPTDPQLSLPPFASSALVLGSKSAVGAGSEAYLVSQLGAGGVDRVGGQTRYETAAMVAQYGVDSGLQWNGVGISTGTDFPDALTGGVALGLNRCPLLLTPPDGLHAAAKAKLTTNKADIDSFNVIGGPSVISAGVMQEIKSILGL